MTTTPLPAAVLLREVIAKSKLSVNAWARAKRLDSSVLHKILTGQIREISVYRAAEIDTATAGKVPMRAWLER